MPNPSSISGASQVISEGNLNSGAKLEGQGTFVTPSGKRSVKLKDGEPKVGRENKSAPADSPPNKARTISAVKSKRIGEEKTGDDPELLVDIQEDSSAADVLVSEGSEETGSSTGVMDDQRTQNQDLIDSFDEVETSSTYSNDSGYSDSGVIQDDPEDQDMFLDDAELLTNTQENSSTADDLVPELSEYPTPSAGVNDALIPPPGKQFPVPVNPKTAGASIAISGGNDVDSQDASLTIEGGSKIGEQTVSGAIKDGLKKLWSWAVDFASNHKIAIGLALSIIFVFIMASPAGPGIAGGLLGAALIASLGANVACALVGVLIVDLIGGIGPYADQTPPQSNTQNQQSNTQNQQSNTQNQQSNQKDASTSDKSDENKTVSDSKQDSGKQDSGTAGDSEGSFFLTPKEKMAAESAAKEEGRSLAAGVGTDRAASTEAAGTQPEKEFTLEAFNSWLDENFGRWTNKEQYAEFSKTLSGNDNYESLEAQNKLDEYLGVLSQKRLDLSVISSAPLNELDGSGDRQSDRLYEFDTTLKSALEMLSPDVSHSRKMSADLLRILPKDEFPYVSSDLDSPFLSASVGRKSLEGLSREEMAKIEASDFIRLTLRNLRDFANSKEGKVQPVERKGRVGTQDGEPPEKARRIERAPDLDLDEVEQKTVSTGIDVSVQSDEGVQIKLDQELVSYESANRARVVNDWQAKDIQPLKVDWSLENEQQKVWLGTMCNELRSGATELKWSATESFDLLEASDMEIRFMSTHGNGAPILDLDKRYLEIAVEQAALAVKCKIESTVTQADIDSIKQNGSENLESMFQRKEKFIDGVLNSSKGSSKYSIEDAFEAVSASSKDRELIKGYIKGLLINKWKV